IATIVGNVEIIKTIEKVHVNVTNGFYKPFLVAVEKAFNMEQQWYDDLRAYYQNLRQNLTSIISSFNFLKIPKHQEGMFLWTKIEGDYTTEEIIKYLYLNYGIKTVPGALFGTAGKNYIRWSLCINPQKIQSLNEKILSYEYNK